MPPKDRRLCPLVAPRARVQPRRLRGDPPRRMPGLPTTHPVPRRDRPAVGARARTLGRTGRAAPYGTYWAPRAITTATNTVDPGEPQRRAGRRTSSASPVGSTRNRTHATRVPFVRRPFGRAAGPPTGVDPVWWTPYR